MHKLRRLGCAGCWMFGSSSLIASKELPSASRPLKSRMAVSAILKFWELSHRRALRTGTISSPHFCLSKAKCTTPIHPDGVNRWLIELTVDHGLMMEGQPLDPTWPWVVLDSYHHLLNGVFV